MQVFNNARYIVGMVTMSSTIPYTIQASTSREARKIRKILTSTQNWARTYLAAHEITSRVDCENVDGTIQYTLHLTVKMLHEKYEGAQNMERIMSGDRNPFGFPKDDLMQVLPEK